LADRVAQLMIAEAPNLAGSAAGRDEVSQRVAASLSDVRVAFTASTSEGIDEIWEAAAMWGPPPAMSLLLNVIGFSGRSAPLPWRRLSFEGVQVHGFYQCRVGVA
jgi:hypothetical protein